MVRKHLCPILFLFGLAFCLFPQTVLGQASLSLSPSSGSYEVGGTFQVNIQLNTGASNTDGVDIYYLHYPRGLLQVRDAVSSVAGVQISAGSLYPNTLSNAVNTTNGTIDFSQTTSGGQHFIGSGVLATITFNVVSTGSANLFFDFTSGRTTDCNVVSGITDILNSATGAIFTITENQPPTATVSASPVSGKAPLTVNFTGAGVDTDGTIVSYSWTFGDGTTSSLQNPSHTYTSAGNYSAILTVVDDDGDTGSDSVDISVTSAANSPPTVSVSASPMSGNAPLTVNFTGAGVDTDGTIVSFSWTFGDGGASNQQNPSHAYAARGNYTATLTVRDDDNAIGSASVNITVGSAPAPQDCSSLGGVCKPNSCSNFQSCSSLGGNCSSGYYCCQGSCQTPPSSSPGPSPSPSPSPTPTDSSALAISSVQITNITDSSVVISWLTNKPARLKLYYGKTSYLEQGYEKNDTYKTSHSVSLTKLSPNTNYYIQIVTVDQQGNPAKSSHTFKTITMGAAPSTPLTPPAPSGPSGISFTPPSGLSEDELIAWLKARIAEILALIAELQAKIALLQTSQAPSQPSSQPGFIPLSFRFERDLKTGDQGAEVSYLQIFLKMQGPSIYPEGLVTGYFGSLTKAAVIRFQEKYAAEILFPWRLAKGTGLVGGSTRAKLNKLLAE